jgi:putative spermidine/putrescine transport system substrate-binding protein
VDIDRILRTQEISRRNLLKRGGILAGAAIGMPAILAACAPNAPAPPAGSTEPTAIDTSDIAGSTIKVGTYGGFFEENFKKMYPAFTKEFDVEVQSVPEPTSETWVVQLQQAIAAGGTPPADVSMLSGVGLQRAINGEILATYQTSDIPESENLAEGYIKTDADGNDTGVGGLSWYITLVSNTDRVKVSPDTWTAFWDPQWEDELAMLRNDANSFLIEITATCLFDG